MIFEGGKGGTVRTVGEGGGSGLSASGGIRQETYNGNGGVHVVGGLVE